MAEQISVSRETLRAELGELKLSFSDALAKLELRLLDRLADKAELAAVEAKVGALAQVALIKNGPVDRRVEDLHDRLHHLEASSTGRAYLDDDYKETRREVQGLVRWRNMLAGGLLVLGAIGGGTAARVFFGIG